MDRLVEFNLHCPGSFVRIPLSRRASLIGTASFVYPPAALWATKQKLIHFCKQRITSPHSPTSSSFLLQQCTTTTKAWCLRGSCKVRTTSHGVPYPLLVPFSITFGLISSSQGLQDRDKKDILEAEGPAVASSSITGNLHPNECDISQVKVTRADLIAADLPF